MMKYLSFHNSFFCLKILFNVNGKATMWHTPCSLDLSKVYGFKPCIFVHRSVFKREKTHLGLNYTWKNTLFKFFSSKMSLVVARSSSLGGRGDKNLSFCRFRYSCWDFCFAFEQEEGTYLSNNNKPLACWFSSQMNSTFLYGLPFKVKAT